jgi:glucose/arabinose dehydrogenase
MSGVAIDPDYANNRFIYVYSASSMTAPGSNRVLRLTVSPDLTSVSNRQDIVTDIAYKPAKSDHPFGDPGAHNGGRRPLQSWRRLPVCDDGRHPQWRGAAKPNAHRWQGAAHRPGRQGGARQQCAPGLRSSGLHLRHRNPQGICFRPGTNQAFTAENGPWHSDEVTALVAGGNAGWDPRPNVGGRGDCPDKYCGYSPNQMGAMDPKERAAFMPMTDTKTYPNAMQPRGTTTDCLRVCFHVRS